MYKEKLQKKKQQLYGRLQQTYGGLVEASKLVSEMHVRNKTFQICNFKSIKTYKHSLT